jgi:sporulation protein YlmC with PRC-barrel domain
VEKKSTMQRHQQCALVAGVALIAAVASLGPASAQQRESVIPDQSRFVDHPVWQNTENAVRARSVIGLTVQDARGREIGTVDDLLVGRDGKVSHALIAVGPLANLTGRKIVVPWSELRIASVEEHVRKAPAHRRDVATIDERVLEAAPRFEPESDVSPAASPSTAPPRSR